MTNQSPPIGGLIAMNKLIIYAYTFPSIIIAGKHFRHIKVKVGQTAYKHNEDPELSANKRISEQMGTSSAEDFVLLKYWVIEKTDSLPGWSGKPRAKPRGLSYYSTKHYSL